MNLIDAVILGIIEGLTEFIPVSSTAHLVLGAQVLGLTQTDFVKSFEVVIQFGAILAVIVLYFKSFFQKEVLRNIIVGFLPTAIIGLLAYRTIKEYLGDMTVILWALILGGVFLIVFELFHKRQSKELVLEEKMTLKQCIIVGFCQCFAFIPGVSRSAATIIGGMMLGIGRATIAEYSFLLAVPTIASASVLDFMQNREVILNYNNLHTLAVGFIVSFVIALVAIKAFITFVKKRDFIVFGVYRVLIAIVFFLFVL